MAYTEYVDITLRTIPGLGFLPILISESQGEVYRGEYHHVAEDALHRAIEVAQEKGLIDNGMLTVFVFFNKEGKVESILTPKQAKEMGSLRGNRSYRPIEVPREDWYAEKIGVHNIRMYL